MLRKKLSLRVAGGGDVYADVVGDGELAVRPAAEGGRVDVGAALHVLERGDEQARFGGGYALQELLRGGREDDGGLEVRGVLERRRRASSPAASPA